MSEPAALTQPTAPEILPIQLYDPIYRLKPGSQALYGYFWVYYHRYNGESPSRSEAMAALNIGAEAYQTYLKGLIEKGFLIVREKEAGRFTKNDYILTYPNNPVTINPCTEKPTTGKSMSDIPAIRLVPSAENAHFKPFSGVDSSNVLYNNIITNQEEEESSSSSSSFSYDYSEVKELSKVLIEEYPSYSSVVELYLNEILRQRKIPDVDSFRFIVEKFITKAGTRNDIGAIKSYAISMFNNDYDFAKAAIATQQKKSAGCVKGNTSGTSVSSPKKKDYHEIQRRNAQEELRRKEYIKEVAPEVFEFEEVAGAMRMEMMKYPPGSPQSLEIMKKIDAIYDRRDSVLEKMGFNKNYLDKIYSCPKCKDTGFDEDNIICCCNEE